MSREVYVRQLDATLQSNGYSPTMAARTAEAAMRTVNTVMDRLEEHLDTITCNRLRFDVEGIALGVLAGMLHSRQQDLLDHARANGVATDTAVVDLGPGVVTNNG